MDMRVPLAISVGDPGGVGPEVALAGAAAQCREDRVVLFGDVQALCARALALGIAARRLVRLPAGGPYQVEIGDIGFASAGAPWSGDAAQHRPTVAGGHAQIAALDAALHAVLTQQARALVTAPMSKAAVHLAGYTFTGHTEHLARAALLADDDVTMMFLGPRLRVALVTTHLALADVPRAITQHRVLRTIEHLGQAILRLAPDEQRAPSIVVTGLNPHAGEGGMFGDEEPRAIAPAIAAAQARAPFCDGRVRLHGPLGAETAFRQAASGAIDAVVAMTHDQATIASKLLDWTLAVNVTWGLPFVRTSVDHGVAYDAALSGTADAQGMISAIAMAQRLTARPAP